MMKDNKKALIEWKQIYRLMDNVKTKMELDYEENNGSLTDNDVTNILWYINRSLDSIYEAYAEQVIEEHKDELKEIMKENFKQWIVGG